MDGLLTIVGGLWALGVFIGLGFAVWLAPNGTSWGGRERLGLYIFLWPIVLAHLALLMLGVIKRTD